MRPVQIPLAASVLFCGASILLGLVDTSQVRQCWHVAALFLLIGMLAAVLILYVYTIKPLQAELDTAVRQRIDADLRRQAAERSAAASALASEIETDRLAALRVEFERKTVCVSEQGVELHEKLLILDQRLRATTPKQKPHRGGDSRGGPPKF